MASPFAKGDNVVEIHAPLGLTATKTGPTVKGVDQLPVFEGHSSSGGV